MNKNIKYMENEIKPKNDYLLPSSIVVAAVILAGAWVYTTGLKAANLESKTDIAANKGSEEVVLPVRWGNLGVEMANAGVIDRQKFESLYLKRGGLDEESRKLLYQSDNGNLKITAENSGIILNLLWALGLGNKNTILESGPMNDPQYGGAGSFASTGGWTLAAGETMDHYSQHPFAILTPEQQQIVERVAKNIYRPCCGNSTYFPDCNHGMAMLGLLELMTSQGVSEDDMYQAALTVNSYWFPDTYAAIHQYLALKGMDSNQVRPQQLLGRDFSSATGYRKILSELKSFQPKNSGGCGVDAGVTPSKISGCGV
ncbi:MAG: hypothetical protein A3H63_01645 [Candidatus Harrisonbacteria bacterium RIFCSPLOWO2_02_FULL_45_10c]|uniref:Uncharacterized protein n=1 Tax=Candidatus Harrisonbacteria bacterium RIFCSPLOWO2_02_FULL_45_10c TaxID=1798410 RepID=A0A1G1ZTH6_9BACT|nr:MAG: hypothetical protein A3H63_01645 [Candidatus Harrisonbacteria bacterium RIFCSPLOWO2_02_FULL_45_10c]